MASSGKYGNFSIRQMGPSLPGLDEHSSRLPKNGAYKSRIFNLCSPDENKEFELLMTDIAKCPKKYSYIEVDKFNYEHFTYRAVSFFELNGTVEKEEKKSSVSFADVISPFLDEEKKEEKKKEKKAVPKKKKVKKNG